MSENPPGGSLPPQPDDPGKPVPPPPPPPASGYGPPSGSGYGPPPGGGYGSPATGGGYPPAPPPGYGAPQGGAYPPAGYGQPTGAGGADVVMDGVKYGWKKFTENVGPYILGGLVWFGALAILIGIAYAIIIGSAMTATQVDEFGNVTSTGGGFLGFGSLVFFGIAVLLSVLVQVAYLNASLVVAAGRKAQVGDFFRFPNLGKVIGTALLVAVATGIGTMLLILPGLVVAFFTSFAIVFALDRGLGPVDAIKASIDLVKRNIVPVLLLLVAVYIITAIGSAICGVGILAAYPIAYLTTVFVYRRLQNQQVAP